MAWNQTEQNAISLEHPDQGKDRDLRQEGDAHNRGYAKCAAR
jgi:hypothetical protein